MRPNEGSEPHYTEISRQRVPIHGANGLIQSGKMAEFEALNGHPVADLNTVAADIGIPAEPKPRRRGRQPGSKNQVGADAKAMLAMHGLAGIRILCNIAAGKPVWRPLKGGGRERVVPELADMIAAQKAILSRLVPELKATELSGPDGASLLPPPNARETAKAVIEVLAGAVPGGTVNVEQPGTYTAKFADIDLGRRILPDAAGEAPSPPDGPGPHIIDDCAAIVFVPDRGKWALCAAGDVTGQPMEWHPSYEAAAARVPVLLAAKKLWKRTTDNG